MLIKKSTKNTLLFFIILLLKKKINIFLSKAIHYVNSFKDFIILIDAITFPSTSTFSLNGIVA